VIGSKRRLARNLADFNFMKYACRGDLQSFSEQCEKVLSSHSILAKNTGLTYVIAWTIKKWGDPEHRKLLNRNL
jgi:hypothetical protein